MDKLKNLYVYLAEDCNLKCKHCWVDSGPFIKKNRLAYNQCINFFNDAIDLGLEQVILSGGEPFLNIEIEQFIDFFFRHNIEVTIETNGTLLNDKKCAYLAKYKPFLAISIDGASKNVHEMQRGLHTYDKTTDALFKLEKNELKYQLIMAISKANDFEIESLFNYVKNNLHYCQSVKLNPIVKTGRAENMSEDNLLHDFDELKILVDKIHSLSKKYTFQIFIHLEKPFMTFKQILDQFSCGGNCGISNSLSILPTGECSVCSLGRFTTNEFQFGKVDTIKLKRLWESNQILKDFRDKKYPYLLKGICNNCIFKIKCRGSCRAQSLIKYADIYAPYPKCQDLFEAGKFPENMLVDKNAISTYAICL